MTHSLHSWRTLASFVLVLSLLQAAASQSQAFTFKSPNIEIKLVLEAMAKEAGVNILLDKSVRGTVPVNLTDVDPLEAMRIIVALHRLAMKKVEAGGPRGTYVIGDPSTVNEDFAKSPSAHGAPDKSEWPTSAIHANVCGIHFYNGELSRQIVAHHYCSHLSADMLQCVIYDSHKKDARLIGVEYIVSEKIFKSLPEEEKKLWHSHAYEIKSGALMSLGMPADQEKELMKGLMTTYGKTWHFWQVDRGDTLPLGEAKLMMGFTADGQARAEVVGKRDREFGVSTSNAKKARGDIPDVSIADGANAWMKGETLQVELRKIKESP